MSGSKTKSISVLGERWTILDNQELDDADGIADKTVREIQLSEIVPGKNTVKDIGTYKRKVLRHEIVHAFLFESGLQSNSPWSEEQVDWVAVQFPKLMAAFKSAGCDF